VHHKKVQNYQNRLATSQAFPSVGIGIFLGVLDALAVFEWGGLSALGGGKSDPMLGYVVIFGVALWLLVGMTLAIVLYWWLQAKHVSDFQQKVARLEAFYRQQETQIGKAQANLLKIGAEITSRRGEGLEV